MGDGVAIVRSFKRNVSALVGVGRRSVNLVRIMAVSFAVLYALSTNTVNVHHLYRRTSL